MDNGNVQAEEALTYLGTFDDSVARYPWNISIDDDYLEQTIARHVVLGDKLLLNDGYLVMHRLGRKSLLEGSNSLLFNLLADGFVRVLSSDHSIAASIRKRAESGVAEHNNLLNSPDWPDLQRRLDWISDRQAKNGYFHPWPKKDMTHGFVQAIERCRGRTPSQLGIDTVPAGTFDRVLDELQRSLRTDHGAARTKFEQSVRTVVQNTDGLGNPQEIVKQCMWIANEAYHNNFATCLSTDDSKIVYGVETRQSRAFDELYDTTEVAAKRLEAFQPIGWPSHPAFKEPERLRSFVVPGPAMDAKARYLHAMNAYLSGDASIDTYEYQQARDDYIAFVSRHFGEKWEAGSLRFQVSVMLFGLSALADLLVSPVPGMATSGLLFYAEQKMSPMLIKKLAIKDVQDSINYGRLDGSDNQAFQRLKKSGVLASVSLDVSKARELSRSIPNF